MARGTDLSFLDQPEILEIIFPLAYSPFLLSNYPQSPSPAATSYSIEVEKGIRISCGFWISSQESPSILYFHGNGETVADYNWIAPFYHQRGMNLFVVDYRGYGSSTGLPTISNMLNDASSIFKGFTAIIKKESFRKSLFIMGRSLGSMPAIEVSLNYQDEIRGLLIDSGTANNFCQLWSLVANDRETTLGEESTFLNKVKIRQIRKPTLIIHGEYDDIVPVAEAEELYRNSGAQDKRILIIPGAGHNDIMMAEHSYFGTIEEFIKAYR